MTVLDSGNPLDKKVIGFVEWRDSQRRRSGWDNAQNSFSYFCQMYLLHRPLMGSDDDGAVLESCLAALDDVIARAVNLDPENYIFIKSVYAQVECGKITPWQAFDLLDTR